MTETDVKMKLNELLNLRKKLLRNYKLYVEITADDTFRIKGKKDIDPDELKEMIEADLGLLSQTKKVFMQLTECLRLKDRLILILHYVYGYTDKKLAEDLNYSVYTIKKIRRNSIRAIARSFE